MNLIKLGFVCLFCAIISGCGGSSTESPPFVPTPPPVAGLPAPTPVVVPPTVNSIPTINVQTQISANESTKVQISAIDSSDSDGSISKIDWQQISGPDVVLINANSLIVSFTAPVVTISQDVILRLTIFDNDNAEATANITITVENTELIRPLLIAEVRDSNLELYWTESFASKYRVLYMAEGQTPIQLFTNVVGMTINNPQSGNYTFYVEAYDELGNSLFSSPTRVLVQ